MGKGFNNYMCKKFFHPASRDNLKRVWMAEQQAEAYKKKQEELRTQYEKEQNLHDNKALLSKDSKDKLSVNFMYELPAGLRREHEQQHELNQEHDVKFEWQRKFNAPRESYCKGDTQIRDQPFGIQVRNVRCIKCHKWGHINTDKECSMYSVSMSEARKMHATHGAIDVGSTAALQKDMHNDGLKMKNSAMELQQIQQNNERHSFVGSDGEADEGGRTRSAPRNAVELGETSFIKTLTREQKLDLLKKMELIERKRKEMERMERKHASGSSKKKKRDKKENKKKRKAKGDHKKKCKSKDKTPERSSLKRRQRDRERSPSPVPSKRSRQQHRDDATERRHSRSRSRSPTPRRPQRRRHNSAEKRTTRRRRDDSAASTSSSSDSTGSSSDASVGHDRGSRRRERSRTPRQHQHQRH